MASLSFGRPFFRSRFFRFLSFEMLRSALQPVQMMGFSARGIGHCMFHTQASNTNKTNIDPHSLLTTSPISRRSLLVVSVNGCNYMAASTWEDKDEGVFANTNRDHVSIAPPLHYGALH